MKAATKKDIKRIIATLDAVQEELQGLAEEHNDNSVRLEEMDEDVGPIEKIAQASMQLEDMLKGKSILQGQ